MKKQNLFARVAAIVGVALIVVGVGTLLYSNIMQTQYAKQATQLVATLKTLMPSIHAAALDDRANKALPVMQVQGSDYCGIVELPVYHTALPVHAVWDAKRVTQYPCRYLGSIYDGPLIIGGSDAPGQFHFMDVISLEDEVYITDMTGERYRYRVQDIQITDDVSTEALKASPADLILFAKNAFSLQWTVVRCTFATQ